MIHYKFLLKILLVILFFSFAFSISLSIAQGQDSDEDGVADVSDNCQYEYNPYQGDDDQDLIGNVCDNCPTDYNPDQEDSDEDGIGDICAGQACMLEIYDYVHLGSIRSYHTYERTRTRNATYEAAINIMSENEFFYWDGYCYVYDDGEDFHQLCMDGSWSKDYGSHGYNGIWNVVCGIDTDLDSYPDFADNCPEIANFDQSDDDFDDIGDVCDPCPNDSTNDADGDGVCRNDDNCPNDYNPGQENIDNDSRGDICDNCVSTPNFYQGDDDEDLIGNLCDNCPTDFNPGQEDSDLDGIGDICVGERCMIFHYNLPDFIHFDPFITEERTRTQAATFEAASRNFNPYELEWSGTCYYYRSDHIYLSECQNGDWYASNSDLGEYYSGSWNVRCGADTDGDLYPDLGDNCYEVPNPDQDDVDDDHVGDACDNCLHAYNPRQEDTYPNGIGDACDCEGNFNCDYDVDGTDLSIFKTNFGRSSLNNPCINENPCKGDFDCDGDCDGTDASIIKTDFGRSATFNTCPFCQPNVNWCVY
jgi:hypothetical protein